MAEGKITQVVTFEQVAESEMLKAWEIVREHIESGENRIVALPDMFPHGVQDILFVLWQKLGRCLGYELSGQSDKVYQELQDVVNYAAFGLAILATRGAKR